MATATNVALFGGLILSACSATLAILSGRWFATLREDDSEFLLSQWLAANVGQKPTPIIEYLKFQQDSWLSKLPSQFQPPSSPIDASHRQSGIARSQTATGTPAQEMPTPDSETGNVISSPLNLNPRERYVRLVVEAIEQEMEGETTIRERLMAKALVSAIGIYCAAFILFVLGIELPVWNTQPVRHLHV